MPQLPTGTVTFLFSDIEGSTRLLQALGDGFSAVLETQQHLLRQAFAAGVEVATEGDSFFVAFASAPDAVLAAAVARRALAAHPWPDGVGQVRVRMGLHTGAGTMGGDNYVGIDVHRAARIAAVAHGGQVVISDATRALTEAGLPDDLSLIDLREHRLKDLERPEHLYQLSIAGLPSEFPPLRSLETPTNLPSQLTSFVGREHEAAEARALLATARLVTLTGPGGTGKTRLSLQVAASLLDSFPGGVYLVELAPIADPNLVASTIATSLGLQEDPVRPVVETLKSYLRDREVLLVLDNFEQIVAAAAPRRRAPCGGTQAHRLGQLA